MDFKELVNTRQATREFTSAEIPQCVLDYILECASAAPSACNRQPWKIYVVKSEEGRSKMARCYNREWAKSAPVFMLLCIDHQQEWVRPADGKEHGIIDVSILAEHICLAAAEKNVGTCWVCNFDTEEAVRQFSLPSNLEPAVLIPMGYSDLPIRDKDRKPIEEIIVSV